MPLSPDVMEMVVQQLQSTLLSPITQDGIPVQFDPTVFKFCLAQFSELDGQRHLE